MSLTLQLFCCNIGICSWHLDLPVASLCVFLRPPEVFDQLHLLLVFASERACIYGKAAAETDEHV